MFNAAIGSVGNGAAAETQASTQSFARKCFNFLSSKCTSAIFATEQCVARTIDNLIFDKTAVEALSNHCSEQLEQMSPNGELVTFNSLISRMVSTEVVSFTNGLPEGIYKVYLQEEWLKGAPAQRQHGMIGPMPWVKGFLERLVSSLTAVATVNIAKQVESKGKSANLVNMAPYVLGFFKEKMAAAENEIQDAESKISKVQTAIGRCKADIVLFSGDTSNQSYVTWTAEAEADLKKWTAQLIVEEAELKNILAPIVDHLLSLAFPNGEYELPLSALGSPLRSLIWSSLRKHLVDNATPYMLALYREYAIPKHALENSRKTLHRILGAENSEKARATAKMVESVCGIVSKKITTLIEDKANHEIEKIVGQSPLWIKNLELDVYIEQVVNSSLM